MTLLKLIKAVASPIRLAVLQYLKDPVANFPPQVDGNPTRDGVCADFIREKLNIPAATASRHLTILTEAGLLSGAE
jgi:ArsR family transcriptional regulator